MDIKKVGEKLLTSVKSARSFSLLPSTSNRPEVPARAMAAAAVARALAGLPYHQRLAISSKSGSLASLYACEDDVQTVEPLEEDYYEEDFDPVRYALETISSGENDISFIENKVSQRLLQLDAVTEQLSHQVMEHHEEMVKGMQLVMELQHDLQVANVICKNGRRNLASSMHEVSQDLVITESAKKKQFYLDLLPVLSQLKHALHVQSLLDSLVEHGLYGKAFQSLAEVLQLLDRFSELSAIRQMNFSIEAWVSRTLEKLDSVLLQVCKKFSPENYATVLDAYALIDDMPGLVEKLQNYFTHLVLSETQTILKGCVIQELGSSACDRKNRLTYNDLCLQLPETKFRHCLLKTLELLFDLMNSYHYMMSWRPDRPNEKASVVEGNEQNRAINRHRRSGSFTNGQGNLTHCQSQSSLASQSGKHLGRSFSCTEAALTKKPGNVSEPFPNVRNIETDCERQLVEAPSTELFKITSNNNDECVHNNLWNELRMEAAHTVGQALDKGRRNFWQIVSSRISTYFSSDVVFSTSMHQFLQCCELVRMFILAGEAFCGVEATQFRQKLRGVSDNYFGMFHRQNTEALRIVMEKETWQKISQEAISTVNLDGLVGNGAALLVAYKPGPYREPGQKHLLLDVGKKESHAFNYWSEKGNPFRSRKPAFLKDGDSDINELSELQEDKYINGTLGSKNNENSQVVDEEEESEDLLADFIDEDSQLPSRVSNSMLKKSASSRNLEHEEIEGLTASSVCCLRSMDKYARLMQKMETISFEIFKGICQLFDVYFYFIFKNFVQRDASSNYKSSMEYLNPRLKSTVVRIVQNLNEQRQKMQGGPAAPQSPHYFNGSLLQLDVASAGPVHPSNPMQGRFHGLKERCTAAKSVVCIAEILHKAKAHMQSMLPQTALPSFEDFFAYTVDCASDLREQVHRTTARQMLNISGYVERISNARWEVKELGTDHNGYVDQLLGEFNHFKTKLTLGEIGKKDEDALLEYGVDEVVEILVEGFSRVRKCTNEGRALMSLDLQVLFNGLQHLASSKIKSKMQVVEAYIKAYYLPETEYIHWARAHPEYTKSQVTGLINLVASMNNWKRKARVELIEKIEAGDY